MTAYVRDRQVLEELCHRNGVVYGSRGRELLAGCAGIRILPDRAESDVFRLLSLGGNHAVSAEVEGAFRRFCCGDPHVVIHPGHVEILSRSCGSIDAVRRSGFRGHLIFDLVLDGHGDAIFEGIRSGVLWMTPDGRAVFHRDCFV